MTGNDIISRKMMHSLKRPMRYAGKILSSSEINLWTLSGQLVTDIWKYWALKEAAYKIYVKKGGERKLNPKQFVVQWKDDSIYVTNLFHDEHYAAYLTKNNHFIHAVLWEGKAKVKSDVFSQSQTDPDIQSRELRQSFSTAVGTDFSSVEKNDRNIPILSGWDISLSHCGKWGAWSAIKL